MLLSLSAIACSASTDIGTAKQPNEQATQDNNALITSGTVFTPVRRFMLIRKGNDACAVRFLSYRSLNDQKPPTVFNSGHANQYAEYEWFYQGDGSFDFTKKSAKSGKENLHIGPATGIGHDKSFPRDMKFWITCGPFNYFWQYSTGIGFNSYPKNNEDREVEFAPSKWMRVEEIDFANPKLRWTRYSASTRRIEIPLEELP